MSKIDQRQTEQKPAQEFAIITKAKDLVKHTFMMTSERRFPKKYRFTIVNRLHDLTLDIFQHIQEANELDLTDPQEYRERRYEQKKALTECKTVLFLIELSFEKELRAGRLGLQQSAGKRAGPNLPGVRPAVVLHYAACYLGGGHNALFDLGV